MKSAYYAIIIVTVHLFSLQFAVSAEEKPELQAPDKPPMAAADTVGPARPSPENNIRMVRELAARGNAVSQYYLGFAYYKGVGVEQDFTQAFEWIAKAAEQGLSDAQYNLGVMYSTGEGTEKDENKAIEWFLKAAEQDHAGAQHALGTAYLQGGRNLPQNKEAAATWFQKAAEQGFAASQYNLAIMYSLGDGVAKDPQKAISWSKKAADQGLESAKLFHDRLCSQGPWVCE